MSYSPHRALSKASAVAALTSLSNPFNVLEALDPHTLHDLKIGDDEKEAPYPDTIEPGPSLSPRISILEDDPLFRNLFYQCTDARRGIPAIGLPSRMPSGWHDLGDGRRIMHGEVSLFYLLHNYRCGPIPDFWSRSYTDKRSTALPKSQLEEIISIKNLLPFSKRPIKMDQVVLEEFTGRIPVACIKYYSLYVLCLQILHDIADLKLRQNVAVGLYKEDDSMKANPVVGFHFVENLLATIVDLFDIIPKHRYSRTIYIFMNYTEFHKHFIYL